MTYNNEDKFFLSQLNSKIDKLEWQNYDKNLIKELRSIKQEYKEILKQNSPVDEDKLEKLKILRKNAEDLLSQTSIRFENENTMSDSQENTQARNDYGRESFGIPICRIFFILIGLGFLIYEIIGFAQPKSILEQIYFGILLLISSLWIVSGTVIVYLSKLTRK